MSSTPGPKPKLGYMYHGHSREKAKDANEQSVEKAKMAIGNEFTDLFSHMNKDNLNYISNQIKEMEKEKRKTQRKPSMQQRQLEFITIESPQASQIGMTHMNNPIVELDASQEETQRSQESRPNVAVKEQPQMKLEQLQIPLTSDRQMHDEPTFIQFLDNYICSLGELPPPKQKITKAQSNYVQPKPSYGFEPPALDQAKLSVAFRTLQRKLNKQRMDSSLLASELQSCRRKEQQQKDHMVRLQQKTSLLVRDIQRLKYQQSRQFKKRDLIREVMLNDSHNRSTQSMHQRVRSREGRGGYDVLNDQYENFKFSTRKYQYRN